MATHYKTRGFVFKKNDLNESDKVFSVFTEDFGKLDIFAKAIRKSVSKLRSGIDVFFMSDIEFIQGKNRKTLTDAVAIERFNNLSPEKFIIANSISQVLDNFLKGQEKDKNIFNLINETFKILNVSKVRIQGLESYYYFFLWNFLALLGYKPEVDKCVICRQKLNPLKIYFSKKLGGTICSKCLTHDNLSTEANSDVIKILRLILKKDWQTLLRLRITPDSRKLFQQISDGYYAFLSPK